MQGVQPKVKLVIINKKTNDVLKEFFSNNVSLVTAKVSDSLYNDGKIDSNMYKFLKNLLKLQKNSLLLNWLERLTLVLKRLIIFWRNIK